MSGERVSARRLAELRDELTGRDLALLRQVAELRLMTSLQIEAIHFGDDRSSALASARAARRTLERLTRDRLLLRLERRIGGVRAGSASFVYGIGPVGERLLGLAGPRRRFREPSPTFLSHTLAISQLVADLAVSGRRGDFELLGLQTEPRCWRRTVNAGGGVTLLRPDLFLAIGTENLEYRWFIEVDLGTEHLPTVLRKCAAYEAHYRAGTEQAEHGVFPRVLWLMHSEARAERLRQAVAADSRLTPALFVVTTFDRAITVASGAQP